MFDVIIIIIIIKPRNKALDGRFWKYVASVLPCAKFALTREEEDKQYGARHRRNTFIVFVKNKQTNKLPKLQKSAQSGYTLKSEKFVFSTTICGLLRFILFFLREGGRQKAKLS